MILLHLNSFLMSKSKPRPDITLTKKSQYIREFWKQNFGKVFPTSISKVKCKQKIALKQLELWPIPYKALPFPKFLDSWQSQNARY